MVKPAFSTGATPRDIAHRGFSGMAPENTMAAIDLAVQAGARYIEFDVQLTACHQVVVFHDKKVDRVTEGSGILTRLTYGQLRKLDAGYRFTSDGGKTYPFRGKGIYIPLLEEVLQKHPTVLAYIELKGKQPALIAKVIELLTRYGRLTDGSVIVSSFTHNALKRFRRLAPEARTGSSRLEMWQLALAARLGAPFLFTGKGAAFQLPLKKFRVVFTSRKVVAFAHRLGIEVHTYTIDDESEMRRILAMGVDGIFTNRPDRLRKVIKSLGDRHD